MKINLITAWIEILMGFFAGAIIGLFFYKKDWLGGYNSWKRRMLRLGHISFFGIAIINFIFVYSYNFLKIQSNVQVVSILFIIAAITMPLVCFISAFYKPFRQAFFIPALSLIIGTIIFIYKGGLY